MQQDPQVTEDLRKCAGYKKDLKETVGFFDKQSDLLRECMRSGQISISNADVQLFAGDEITTNTASIRCMPLKADEPLHLQASKKIRFESTLDFSQYRKGDVTEQGSCGPRTIMAESGECVPTFGDAVTVRHEMGPLPGTYRTADHHDFSEGKDIPRAISVDTVCHAGFPTTMEEYVSAHLRRRLTQYGGVSTDARRAIHECFDHAPGNALNATDAPGLVRLLEGDHSGADASRLETVVEAIWRGCAFDKSRQ